MSAEPLKKSLAIHGHTDSSEITTMLAKKPRQVLNPYDWLPSHGETRVDFIRQDTDLRAEVHFDASGGNGLKKKILLFVNVCAFTVSAVPGVQITRVQYEGMDASGALMEFEESEAARMWDQHFGWTEKTVRHFRIWFLSANEQLEVFAESWRLVEV